MQQSKKTNIIILFIFFVIFTETNKINFIIQIVLNFFVAFLMIDSSRCWLEVVTDNRATTVLFLLFVPTSVYVPSKWFFSSHLKTSSVPVSGGRNWKTRVPVRLSVPFFLEPQGSSFSWQYILRHLRWEQISNRIRNLKSSKK